MNLPALLLAEDLAGSADLQIVCRQTEADAEILERQELQVVFKLQPGELMLFDNTRVLHARKAYSASGSRHLQGAYSDLDGLYSSLRMLESNL